MSVQQEGCSSKAPSSKIEERDVLIHIALRPRRIERLILLAVVDARIEGHQSEHVANVQGQLDRLFTAHI